jgi:uncharacterized protein (TIGR02246 family)
MKPTPRRALAASALAALCVAGPARAQQAPAVSEQAAREAAEAVIQRFAAEYNSGNAAGVAALFAQRGVLLTAGGTMVTGRQDIERAFAGRLKAGWTKETIKVAEAHPAGEAIWAIGDYAIAGTGPNSGRQIGGYFAEVLEREGAEWRFRMLIGNLRPAQDVTGMAAASSR